MRMRTRLSIVTLVGAGALLLIALAVISASRPKTVFAQGTDPTVEINLNSYNGVTRQGQSVAQYTFKNFQSITCNKEDVEIQHSTMFDDPCYHRSEVYERGTTTHVSQCGLGGDRSFSKGGGSKKTIRYGSNIISTNCPVGLYTLKVILMGSAKNEEAFATEDFEVVAVPPTPTRIPSSGGGGGGGGGGGNQGGGNQGGGNQGGGNQGGGNQGGGNQGGGNQGGGNQTLRRQPGRRQPGRRQPGRRQPDTARPDRDANSDTHRDANSDTHRNE